MRYNEKEARVLVVEAGRKLSEEGLVARTWGNISARISETEFVITPSGRAYQDLQPEDLARVTIADVSYDPAGPKPSSEKGIHAAAYALRPEVNFVVHTHQNYASALCASGEDFDFAPCAGYGLPGTGKLKNAVAEKLAAHPDKKAFLMAHHGAICLGESFEEAFNLAYQLEKQAESVYEDVISNSAPDRIERARETAPWLDDYAQLVGLGRKKAENAEDAEAELMVRKKNILAAHYVAASASRAKPLGFLDASLQRIVYRLKYSKLKNK